MNDGLILDVRDLTLRFGADSKGRGGLLAVNDVSFDLRRGETLSVVGESGSGKTTIGRCIARLYRPDAGTMRYASARGEVDLAALDASALRPLRREIQMLFQDPNASLNARMRIGAIVAEPLEIHSVGTRRTRLDRVAELLDRVGLGGRHDQPLSTPAFRRAAAAGRRGTRIDGRASAADLRRAGLGA